MNRSQLTQRFIALNSLKDVLKQKSLETFKNGQEGDSNHVKGKYTCRRSGVFSVFVKFPFFRLLPTVPKIHGPLKKKKKLRFTRNALIWKIWCHHHLFQWYCISSFNIDLIFFFSVEKLPTGGGTCSRTAIGHRCGNRPCCCEAVRRFSKRRPDYRRSKVTLRRHHQ